MEKNFNKTKVPGYIMAIIGFLLILFNALNYIFGWNEGSAPLSIVGIVFLGAGMAIVRKSSARM
jgi:hypothetical protein